MRKIGRACVIAVAVAMLGAGTVAARNDAAERLGKLMDEAWELRLKEDPLFATRVGDSRYDDRLPSVTEADNRRRFAAEQRLLDRLRDVDRDDLDPSSSIDYEIFRRLLEDRVAEYGFRTYVMPITNRDGFHVFFPQLPRHMPLGSVDGYRDYIRRLEGFLEYQRQHVSVMRKGIETELVLPRIVLEGYEDALLPHIVDDPSDSLLYEPFRRFPDAVGEEHRRKLEARGRKAIAESVVPAYREFLAFMRDEYVPAARETIGASGLPGGREFYAHRVRRFTTLDLTPEQVHETGLAEVSRIRGEMQEIIDGLEFEGDFDGFLEFLRTDPRFFVDEPEDLMKETSIVLKRMDGELPRLFGRLPRMPYGIRPVPDYIAPRTTTAYYNPPAGDGSRAGFYYVNLYDLPSRPLYEVEALSLHEAVPGHHLQIALQQELGDLHPIRRFSGFTVFVEGWALYAESLGKEVGFYEDPYSDFGRLTYEMWRACRLVVDTGMHAMGWTRQQAIDFMVENSALTVHNITTEVDRYISWPGQALAYKTGQMKIRELRTRAERSLGERFDVRRFHDVVLGSGAVPLDVLEDNVERHILSE